MCTYVRIHMYGVSMYVNSDHLHLFFFQRPPGRVLIVTVQAPSSNSRLSIHTEWTRVYAPLTNATCYRVCSVYVCPPTRNPIRNLGFGRTRSSGSFCRCGHHQDIIAHTVHTYFKTVTVALVSGRSQRSPAFSARGPGQGLSGDSETRSRVDSDARTAMQSEQTGTYCMGLRVRLDGPRGWVGLDQVHG